MASSSTNVALEPRSSIFDVSELVALVAQHLSGHDIAQCIATSKAWAHLFEPFIWQDVTSPRHVPQALAQNRHRIRSLHVALDDHANLCTLADDLPNVTLLSTDTLDQPPGSPNSGGSGIHPPTTGNNTFQSLRFILVDDNYRDESTDWKKEVQCIDYTFRILNHSPGLHRVTLLNQALIQSSRVQSFIYMIEHQLPCLKHLDLKLGVNINLDTGLKFLRVCFNHPRLVCLNCSFSMFEDDYSGTQKLLKLNTFLTTMEDDNQSRKISGDPIAGTRIKSLKLPVLSRGYPPHFICTLLRSHLPNLERFDVPEIYDEEGTSYMESLKVAVAQGCPKLQHIKFLWFEYERHMQEAVRGMIQGCKEMSLKSFYCDGLDVSGTGNQRTMEILLNDHCTTLEEIELTFCKDVTAWDILRIFSMCRSLKKVVIELCGRGNGVVDFETIMLREWVCYDLRELRMTMGRPRIGLEEEGPYHVMVKQVYGRIGRLSKLEVLGLGYEKSEEPTLAGEDCHAFDLTLKHGWLGELAGLKELKHLYMLSDFWSRMGQAEVEFMDAHWPKLEKITFGYYGSKHIAEEPHWQWLKVKRPRLQFC